MKRATFQRFYSPEGDGSIMPPPTPTPEPSPAPRARSAARIECEGCGCSLDSEGKIIRRGDGLKSHMDREDEVKELRKSLDEASARITELTSQVSALTPKKRSILM